MKRENIKSNTWKFFLFILTNRRNYIPILSLYFLSLPNSTANQIGLYTGLGWLAGFLFEIPSGYLSDVLGHKKALILAKVSLLLSTISFISGTHIINFILGSIFIATGFSFTSGTQEALFHNILTEQKREKNYSKIYGKIQGNVSLISVFMILALPLFTKISLIMPIKAYLILDIIGLIISFTIHEPKMKYSAEDEEGKNILTQLKKFKGTGFYITSIFFGLIAGGMMALTSYNIPYAESLGLPIIFAGAIMGGSRFIWFIFGHNLKYLKKIKTRTLMLIETILFPSIFIISAITNNFYLFVSITAILSGYYQSRKSIISEYYMKNFLVNKKFKATMLSIKSQITQIIQSALVFIIGLIMGISFKLGYLTTGIATFILLATTFLLIKKK